MKGKALKVKDRRPLGGCARKLERVATPSPGASRWRYSTASGGGCGPGTMPAMSGSSPSVADRSERSRSRTSFRAAFSFCRSLRANSFRRFSNGSIRGRINAQCTSIFVFVTTHFAPPASEGQLAHHRPLPRDQPRPFTMAVGGRADHYVGLTARPTSIRPSGVCARLPSMRRSMAARTLATWGPMPSLPTFR
jgi:hypothetical protein